MTFPTFASGDVLTATDMNAVGLWLVKTQTIGTAVSSVQVTGAFSSTYDNYRIVVTGGVGSTATANTLRLGATATGYYNAGLDLLYTGTNSQVTTNNGTAWAFAWVSTTDSLMADFDLFGPNLAKRTYWTSRYVYGATTGGGDIAFMGGYLNNTTQYTDFTLFAGVGTFTGGTIRVYGYRN